MYKKAYAKKYPDFLLPDILDYKNVEFRLFLTGVEVVYF